ncbi:sulfatase [Candidatus Poribacteria bacterium]|nr:sulfatase [Candidatus Poribacteria bacterium]
MSSSDLNCILFVIDTLRADHLSCYGYFRNTSPNIDKIAEEGVLFKDAHATAIATGPGFTSIITGLSPIHHRFYLTPWNLPNLIDFDDSIPTLPEIIQDGIQSCTTAAFDNLINFASHMDQFVRGFEYYVNLTRTSKPIHHHVVGGEINKRLIPWLESHSNERFFLFVHYWDPHTPYNQPEEYRKVFSHKPGNLDDLVVKTALAGYEYVPGWGKVGEIWDPDPAQSKVTIDLYDGEIRYVDALVGEVMEALERLNIADRTALIVTSDHGEQLGQHGMYGHGMLHEAVIYIPLIIRCPNLLPEGKIIEGYVQQADIAPTILELMGLDEEKMPEMDGSSLIPVIEGGKGTREEIFVEDQEYRAYMRGSWKYMRNYFSGKEELYEVKSDPMEVINLTEREGGRLKEMRSKLDGWVKENLKGRPDPMWEQVAKVRSRSGR